MINLRLRFLFTAFLLFILTQVTLHAQPKLGVIWDIPANADTAQMQLQEFQKLGISVLEINEIPSDQVWDQINSLDFTVYGNLDINFPITQTFAEPNTQLISKIERRAKSYISHPSVSAIGLFNYGSTFKPDFWEAVTPFAKKINQERPIDLYYKGKGSTQTDSTVVSFTVEMIPVTTANFKTLSFSAVNGGNYFYAPSPELRNYLLPFKHFVTTIINGTDNTTIFLNAEWSRKMTKKHPQFSNILLSLSTDPQPLFPMPEETIPVSDNTALPMIILLVTWGTVALHYNRSPLYRKSLFRYFLAHKFFVDDLFKYLIRSPIPALVIILQNALLLATSAYALLLLLLSTTGQQVLSFYFPSIIILDNPVLSIFTWIFFLILMHSLLSITWLFFSNKKITSFTQVATVFAWPLQLNFLFIGASITFFATSSIKSAILFSGIAFVLFLLSFVFTALDISRFANSKIKHLFKTVLPYLVILSGLLGWAMNREQLIEILMLALNLT